MGNRGVITYSIVLLFGFGLLFPGAAFQNSYAHMNPFDKCDEYDGQKIMVRAKITSVSVDWKKDLKIFNDWGNGGEVEVVYFFMEPDHTRVLHPYFEQGLAAGVVYIPKWYYNIYQSVPYTPPPNGLYDAQSIPAHTEYIHPTCANFLKKMVVQMQVKEIDGTPQSSEFVMATVAKKLAGYTLASIVEGPVGWVITGYGIATLITDSVGLIFPSFQDLGSDNLIIDLEDELEPGGKITKTITTTSSKGFGSATVTFDIWSEFPPCPNPALKKQSISLQPTPVSLDVFQQDRLNQIHYPMITSSENPPINFISANEPQVIPDWIKNNALWWSQGQITDADFVQGIEFMVENKIISSQSFTITDTPFDDSSTMENIPTVNISKTPKSEISIRGNIGYYLKDIPAEIRIHLPDGTISSQQTLPNTKGEVLSKYPLDENSPTGIYNVKILYNKNTIDALTFQVTKDNEVSLYSITDLKIPSWIKNNASWWSQGQITDADFLRGIEFMIEEKIISSPNIKVKKENNFKPNIIEKPANKEFVKKVYETQKWNEVTMKYLLTIKNFEVNYLEKNSLEAWNEFSIDKTPETMKIASDLEDKAKQAKVELQNSLNILKTSQDLANQAKANALDADVSSIELEESVDEQQQWLDSVPSAFETISDFEDAKNVVRDAQKNANQAMQEAVKEGLKDEFSTLPGLEDYTNEEIDQILKESVDGAKYEDTFSGSISYPSGGLGMNPDVLLSAVAPDVFILTFVLDPTFELWDLFVQSVLFAMSLEKEPSDEIESVIPELTPIVVLGDGGNIGSLKDKVVEATGEPSESEEDSSGLINPQPLIWGDLGDILFPEGAHLGNRELLDEINPPATNLDSILLDVDPNGIESVIPELTPIIVLGPNHSVSLNTKPPKNPQISISSTDTRTWSGLTNVLHPDIIYGHLRISDYLDYNWEESEPEPIGLPEITFGDEFPTIDITPPPDPEPEPPTIEFDPPTEESIFSELGPIPIPIEDYIDPNTLVIRLDERTWSEKTVEKTATAKWHFEKDDGTFPTGAKVFLEYDVAVFPTAAKDPSVYSVVKQMANPLIVDSNGDVSYTVDLLDNFRTLRISSMETDDESFYFGSCDEIKISLYKFPVYVTYKEIKEDASMCFSYYLGTDDDESSFLLHNTAFLVKIWNGTALEEDLVSTRSSNNMGSCRPLTQYHEMELVGFPESEILFEYVGDGDRLVYSPP